MMLEFPDPRNATDAQLMFAAESWDTLRKMCPASEASADAEDGFLAVAVEAVWRVFLTELERRQEERIGEATAGLDDFLRDLTDDGAQGA